MSQFEVKVSRTPSQILPERYWKKQVISLMALAGSSGSRARTDRTIVIRSSRTSLFRFLTGTTTVAVLNSVLTVARPKKQQNTDHVDIGTSDVRRGGAYVLGLCASDHYASCVYGVRC